MTKDKSISSLIFLFVLILYPYYQLLEHFSRTTIIIGKNIYTMVFTVAILTVFLLLLDKIVKRFKYFVPVLIGIFFVSILVTVLRAYFYSEDFLPRLFPIRFTYMPIIYAVVSYFVLNYSDLDKKTVVKIIIINSLIQAVWGIIHYYFFPWLMPYHPSQLNDTGSLYYIDFANHDKLREIGLLGNSSVYAHFVLLGMFLLLYNGHVCFDKFKMKKIIIAFLSLIMLWGILLSGSRYPVFIGVILFLLLVLKPFSIRSLFLISLGAIVVFYFINSVQGQYLMTRFLEGGDRVRGEKVAVAIQMLLMEPVFFVLGVPSNIVSGTLTPSGVTFSDNSFFEFILDYGLIFMVYWFAAIYLMLKFALKFNYKILFFSLYFIGCIWLTTSIVWDIWLFFCFTTLCLLDNGDCKMKVQEVS